MRITECRAEDIALLDRHLPSGGATSFHTRRFARHAAGTSTYLIAWSADGSGPGRPVGNAELRWTGCTAPEVRAAVPDCPEINGLLVAEPLRGTGIGTALIHHAEHLTAARSLDRIGLGVDDDGNPRAANLYTRLGYRPTVRYLDRWSCTDLSGTEHQQADPCVFLVRDLGV
ncbi:GNAT family N-acetyltransferase [Streptomyces sp. NPDC006798]|uniref:GNAT family N-acetyltransferase n=1 Tax=Streptomyces sp. NPDC006798 TaxID=3155462 RepID=UPI0033D04998